jgi:hypothetical protein
MSNADDPVKSGLRLAGPSDAQRRVGELSASIQPSQPGLLWRSRLIAAGKPLPQKNSLNATDFLESRMLLDGPDCGISVQLQLTPKFISWERHLAAMIRVEFKCNVIPSFAPSAVF